MSFFKCTKRVCDARGPCFDGSGRVCEACGGALGLEVVCVWLAGAIWSLRGECAGGRMCIFYLQNACATGRGYVCGVCGG